MNTRFVSTLGTVILLLALTACSDDDNPTGGGGTADTTPPAIASVNPVDAFHVDVTFTEPVTKHSAEFFGNYTIPSIALGALSLQEDQKTVTIASTGSMAGRNIDFTVTGVSDVHGNAIDTLIAMSFTGSDTPDTTPPQVIWVSPSSNAVDTPVGAPVIIRLSDVVQGATGSTGVTWLSGGRIIRHYARFEGEEFSGGLGGRVIWVMPQNPLEPNSLQTIQVAGLKDYAGNTMAAMEWSFSTTSAVDDIRPTLVSTTPANNATNVGVNTKLSFTFSEPMNESIDLSIQLTPVPGYPYYYYPWAIGKTWSNGGKTVTIEPYGPLHDNEQYTVSIEPNNMLDLARNPLEGLHVIRFTTGNELQGGSISGTITGDPGTESDDPTGAMVLAMDQSYWTGYHYRGSAIVADDDTYTLPHLRDDEYQVWAILDSNDDGIFDAFYGDAFGMYGVWGEEWEQPVEASEVEVEGRVDVTFVDFPLFDPSSVMGRVFYSNWTSENWDVKAGLFDIQGFSPTDAPVAIMQLYTPDDLWYFHSFHGLLDGQYYAGAFMDLNHNGAYDPTTEPAGFHGGINSPTPLDVVNGADFLGIVIPLVNPVPGITATSVPWPVSKPNEKFQRLCETMREAIASK